MSEPAEAPWLSPQLLGLTALLLESHQRLFQRPLVRSSGIRLAAQELFVLDQVVPVSYTHLTLPTILLV